MTVASPPVVDPRDRFEAEFVDAWNRAHPDAQAGPQWKLREGTRELRAWWDAASADSRTVVSEGLDGDPDLVEVDRTHRQLLKVLAPRIERWASLDVDALSREELQPYARQMRRWRDQLIELGFLDSGAPLLKASGEGRCTLLRGPRRSSSVG